MKKSSEKQKVYFRKNSWDAKYAFARTEITPLNEVWNMSLSSDSIVIDRDAHSAIRKLLIKNFDSIKFVSPSSIFFYFESEEDEAQFILLATGLEI